MSIVVAGLELEDDLAEGDAPLEALILLKVVADDGGVDWKLMATRGLHTVEAIGAVEFAREQLKRGMFGDDD